MSLSQENSLTSNTQIVYMTWRHYAKWSIHVHGSVNWVITGSRNVLDPAMCQVITLTNAVSFVWNKIQYNDITNISSWKKLQGRLQSISAISTQPHWVDISFIWRVTSSPTLPILCHHFINRSRRSTWIHCGLVTTYEILVSFGSCNGC